MRVEWPILESGAKSVEFRRMSFFYFNKIKWCDDEELSCLKIPDNSGMVWLLLSTITIKTI